MSSASALTLSEAPIVRAQELSLHAPDGTLLLAPASLEVHVRDRIAIRGPSGSGKSLLLRSLCLLEAHSNGEIFWNGLAIQDHQVPAYRRDVLYVPQKPIFFAGTVRENLDSLFRLKAHRDRRPRPEILHSWLEELGKNATFLDKDAQRLSGGEAQVAALIRALAIAPKILCLDEPTSALDPENGRRFESFLEKNFEGAWLWISHDPAQVERIGKRIYSFPERAFVPEKALLKD